MPLDTCQRLPWPTGQQYPHDPTTEETAVRTLTIPARDVRVGDVFDVCAATFGVSTVTATAVEYRPRDFTWITTDHGEPLVFLTDETVTVQRPAR